MNLIIYCLITYEYDSYSYSGIEEHNREYFRSVEDLHRFAIDNGYRIVGNCNTPENEATVEIITVR